MDVEIIGACDDCATPARIAHAARIDDEPHRVVHVCDGCTSATLVRIVDLHLGAADDVIVELAEIRWAIPDLISELIEPREEGLDEHAERSQKPRWAEKTAFDAFHLGPIRRLCEGHVRFVCIHRHGLDATASLADLVDKTGGYVDELHPYLRRHPEPLVALAHAWVDAASAVADLAEHDAGAVSLAYEDLVARPDEVLADLLTALDEPADDDTVAGLVQRALGEEGKLGFGDWKTYARPKIDASSVGRYKKLPQPVLAPLAELCNPLLERLGYDAVRATTVDDEEARRRYELGLMLGRMKAAKAAKSEGKDQD